MKDDLGNFLFETWRYQSQELLHLELLLKALPGRVKVLSHLVLSLVADVDASHDRIRDI
jgi:hypothetical protein